MSSHLIIILPAHYSRRLGIYFVANTLSWRYCIIKMKFLNVVIALERAHSLAVENNEKYFCQLFKIFVLMLRNHPMCTFVISKITSNQTLVKNFNYIYSYTKTTLVSRKKIITDLAFFNIRIAEHI